MAHRLRIAAAVFFVLLAIAFVALWVRSYYRDNIFLGPVIGEAGFSVENFVGTLTLMTYRNEDPLPWNWVDEPPDVIGSSTWQMPNFGFHFENESYGLVLSAPHWFLTALSLAIASLFAFKKSWRFSLRSILIATTLVAFVLGLAVYLI